MENRFLKNSIIAALLTGSAMTTAPLAFAQDAATAESERYGVSSVENYDENRTSVIVDFAPVRNALEDPLPDSAKANSPKVSEDESKIGQDDLPAISLDGGNAQNEKNKEKADDVDKSIQQRREERKKAREAREAERKARQESGQSTDLGTSIITSDGRTITLPPNVSFDSYLNANSTTGGSAADTAASLAGGSSPTISLGDSLVGYDGTTAQKALKLMQSALGTPYVWGGAAPGGFDCSGLVQWAYGQVGVQLPRVTTDQINAGREVPISDIKPGDLVFNPGVSHVQVYVGDVTTADGTKLHNQVIHAPQTGDVVKYSPLGSVPVATVVRVAE